jgi:hypothetical protein
VFYYFSITNANSSTTLSFCIRTKNLLLVSFLQKSNSHFSVTISHLDLDDYSLHCYTIVYVVGLFQVGVLASMEKESKTNFSSSGSTPLAALAEARLILLRQSHSQSNLAIMILLLFPITALGFALFIQSPITIPALFIFLGILGGLLALNHSGNVQFAAYGFMVILPIMYTLLLLGVPFPVDGVLAYHRFGLGNLLFFGASAFVILPPIFILSRPWSIVLNVYVLLLNQFCIWFLPHDAAFNAVVPSATEKIFLAVSLFVIHMALAGICLHATAGVERWMEESSQNAGIIATSQKLINRQKNLESDINEIQDTLSKVIQGKNIPAALGNASELYQIGISLNILSDRLERLSQTNESIQQVQINLSEVSQVLARMSQGDLMATITPTGTDIDGLLLSLNQFQNQIAGWIQSISTSLQESGRLHFQSTTMVMKTVRTLYQIEDRIRNSMTTVSPELQESFTAARKNADILLQTLHAANERENLVMEAVGQIKILP